MFKRILFTAVIVVASSPAFVSAQEFFWSFDEFSRAPAQTVASGTTSGTAYIFADANLQFSQLDLDFSVSSPASITGTTTFNDAGSDGSKFSAVLAVNQNDQNLPPTATDGRLIAVSINFPPFAINNGQQPGDLDADFRPGANAFLLAEVDFDLAGSPGDVANFDLILGEFGAADENDTEIPNITLGNAQLTVAAVPEPSSATLLMLGAAAMVARRRRS